MQAALSGYSDGPMRQIARRLGAPYTLCEVLLDQFVVNVTKGPKARRFLHVPDDDHPCGAQLMGDGPEQFALAAVKLAAAGFDVIDLNFACPVKKVLGRCRGGYLLSQPAVALEIVARVRDALPPEVPLTVKLRRGMDDAPGEPREFLRHLRRRLRPRRGRGHRPRPHRPPALRRGRFLGLPPRGEASCRGADRAGQRRPLHPTRLPRHAGPDRRGRREHRPRGDRQPLDLRPGPRLGGRPAGGAAESCLSSGRSSPSITVWPRSFTVRSTPPAGCGSSASSTPACTRRPSASATPSWPWAVRPSFTPCWSGGMESNRSPLP